jgi:hypothetical protein
VPEASGTVCLADGKPVEGVLVMGADLNYAETDAQGRFRLVRPEMALFFWCTGFLPAARVLNSGERSVHIVLRRAAAMRALA